MRIVIDLQGAQTINRHRGIGRYTLALVEALLRLGGGRHQFWLVENSQLPLLATTVRRQLCRFLPTERLLTCQLPQITPWADPSSSWWQRAGELCREAFCADLSPDRVLVTSLFEGGDQSSAHTSIGALFPEIPTTVIFYDLIPLLNAGTYLTDDVGRGWYFNKLENLRRADRLLAISTYARQEAIDSLGLPPERINVIGCGYNSNLFRPDPENASTDCLRRYGITAPYLMHCSTLEPRKNLAGLIEAYSLLSTSLRQRYQLVFVGEVDQADRRLFQDRALQLGCADRLIFTGHVADLDLVALYRGAALFVFPSLHEGFGLPPLEAMACGTPTIGSNCTSLPAVIGRTEALFDPKSPEAIARAISRVLEDPVIAARLRAHGLEQARHFSWDHCAQLALEALELPPAVAPEQCLAWPQIAAQRQDRYRRLVNAVAAIGPATDRDLQLLAGCVAANLRTTDPISRSATLGASLHWRIEGPFDSSYSLALLNRETALALDGLGHQVALHSTEGPGDFAPSAAFLAANPMLTRFYRRCVDLPALTADVTSRNLYPPRVSDLNGRLNLLHHFAWEESGLPAHWVEDFNTHLQGITCLSGHVRKVLIDHGVEVPLAISGCGVDHWQRIEPDPSFRLEARSFRFLHVSSCFPRKGADLLLAAYGQAFSATDDVSLVIKTFANPHNEIHRWLATARATCPDFPEVLVIEEDLSEARLKALYQQCQVLVAPSRAEGFGLPLAEAMISGLAVVTTAWGGQLDFCNHHTAWLVDYRFAPSRSHFDLFDSVWAEADVDHLSQCLRTVHATPTDRRRARSDAGREFLLAGFSWRHAAQRLVAAARYWSEPHPPPESRIGWVTTWNSRCGIAGYSSHLIQAVPAPVKILAADLVGQQAVAEDSDQVIRCWRPVDDRLDRLAATIDQAGLDTLVIQFNYYFFDFIALTQFLESQLDAGRILLLTLHATCDPPGDADKRLALLVPVLKRCHRLLVHAVADLNRLKSLGLVDNVCLFPHGILDYQPVRQAKTESCGPRLLGSYGFFLPHKGLLELIEALGMLRSQGMEIGLRMVNAQYPVPASAEMIDAARRLIHRLGLDDHCQLHTDFLEESRSLTLLEECDLIVFPYQHTGESSSAAVRIGLATGRPVAVTPLAIFDDVAPAVLRLPGTSPTALAEGLAALWQPQEDGSVLPPQEAAEAKRWRDQHRYSSLGNRLLGMCRALRAGQMIGD